MKPEARVLAAKCYRDICLALILRGREVDGAIAGRGCEDLCRAAREKGYMGELRFHAGDCSCGLPRVPGRHLPAESFLLAASMSLPLWLEKTLSVIETARKG